VLASHLRGHINRWVRPVGRAVGRTGISANALTVAGLVIVSVGTVVLASGRLALGGWIVAVGGILDLFDGAVAKATGTESAFGAFLDSTTDRISDGVFFSGIAWYLAHRPASGPALLGIIPGREYPWFGLMLTLAVMVLGFLTSYIKARAEATGLSCNVGVAERGERMFIAAAGVVFNRIVPALILLFVLSAVTVVQRFAHVWRQTQPA
jgi:CDP-diacylglycerol--glycerol-3-phosphate 3-phosphatidyltransferase